MLVVNQYKLSAEEELETLEVDNHKVRQSQIERLKRVRKERDESSCQAALAALVDGAANNENILALAVAAARQDASLGEISFALEQAFGRYETTPRPVTGGIF